MVKDEKVVSRSRQSSISMSKNVTNDQSEDREELDFQFDEELDRPLPAVKQNTFSEWSDSDESEYEEVGDDFINKVMFFYFFNQFQQVLGLTLCCI